MGCTPARTLIVDDYEPWRHFLRLSLLSDDRFQIIGEAGDGLEAIKMCRELHPDLVILDIGLPEMNGLEAARILREVSPESKVVFVSSNHSQEILEGVMALGGGYVLKADAGTKLLPALAAVLEGKQFISHSLSTLNPTARDRDQPRTGVVRRSLHHNGMPRAHDAIFYSEEGALLDRVVLFLSNALKSGNAAVVLATESHRKMIRAKLEESGIDISRAIEEDRYLSFDAEEALGSFMLNGAIDPTRFLNLFQNMITTVTRTAQRKVAIFGECVHLLWEGGRAEAAIQMERLGNDLTSMYNLEILCGYSLARGEMHPQIHQLIWAQHSSVYLS